jgi:hypothetical protein
MKKLKTLDDFEGAVGRWVRFEVKKPPRGWTPYLGFVYRDATGQVWVRGSEELGFNVAVAPMKTKAPADRASLLDDAEIAQRGLPPSPPWLPPAE